MSDRPPALEMRNVSVEYRTRGLSQAVLRDVSFSIAPGESYGLVGESGCGKSTAALAALRTLPRNGRVSGGSVWVDGQDVGALVPAGLRRLRRHTVSMVYQDPGRALNPSMTIARQLAEAFPGGAAPDQAEAILARVRIAAPRRVLGAYPHQLSGGMQQRVVIAMALAKNPALLVLDEPTTGLDATVEAEVLDLLAGLQEEFSTAILFISHNLASVGRMCDRVGVLYAGSLVEEGAAEDLLAQPMHPYTIRLLRCLPAAGRRKQDGPLETIPGFLPPPGSAPPGCIFTARCDLADELCRTTTPPAARARSQVAMCHHADDSAPSAPSLTNPVMPGLDPGIDAVRLATSGPAWYRSVLHALGLRRSDAVGGRIKSGRDGANTVALPASRSGNSGPVLRAERVSKTYRVGAQSLRAVTDVSLALAPGETLGLVGESGCGKTTLARLLLGLVAPDPGGTVQLNGQPVAGQARARSRAARKALQIVFQNPDSALNRSHTVRHLIGRPLARLAGLSGARRTARLAELVSAVRLTERFLPMRPRQLSGGLKQRVAIARAFAGEPAVVICDEPTSALDVSVQAAILNLLAELQSRQQVSYVFISHDLGVVRYLSDRIAVLYLGRIVEIGPAEAVWNGPHHPYTEALLSAAPLLGEPDSGRIRLAGEVPSPLAPPPGCSFSTRCPRKIGAICDTTEPDLPEAEAHAIRCHLPREELGRRGGALPGSTLAAKTVNA